MGGAPRAVGISYPVMKITLYKKRWKSEVKSNSDSSNQRIEN